MRDAAGTTPRHDSRSGVGAAWWSLALLPLSFVLAFAAGEGVASLAGAGDSTSPAWWVMALALVLATAIFACPLLLTARYSNRAATRNGRGARAPLIVGIVVTGLFVVANLASGLMVLVVG